MSLYGHLYFIRPVGMEGPVKIGRSSDPKMRLRQYSHLSPFPLELAVVVEDWGGREIQFHALFSEHHSHHEWFHAHPAITGVIESLSRGTFDPASLPKPRVIGRKKRPDKTPEQLADIRERRRQKVEREDRLRAEWQFKVAVEAEVRLHERRERRALKQSGLK